MGMRGEGTYGEPDCDVGVSRAACAAAVLLVAEGLNHDWVVQCACDGYVSFWMSSLLRLAISTFADEG
jgi:hypothetical protein